jgi:predicted DNA-binding protein
MIRDQPKDDLGRFVSPYDEPLSKKVVGVRLPQSIYERLQQLASEQSQSPGEVLRELAVAALTQSHSQPSGVSEGRLEKTRDSEALLRSADRVLKRLKLGKQASGYKAAVKALNMMISELSSQDQ